MDEPKGEIVIYETSDRISRVDVRLVQETVWLTQLRRDSVVAKYATTAWMAKHMRMW